MDKKAYKDYTLISENIFAGRGMDAMARTPKDEKLKTFNKFITDYDTLRPFLHYISYGCYHKRYIAKQLGQSTRTYEDNWQRVRSCLPEDRRQSTRQGRTEIHSLKGDAYQNAGNFLARTYQIRALQEETACYLLTLLQLLGAAASPYTLHKIRNTYLDGKEPMPAALENVSNRTIQRQLDALADQGLLRRQKNGPGGAIRYELAPDPLAGLTAEQVDSLHHAIVFYRCISMLSVPGYFLEETLRAMYPGAEKPSIPCQFKNSAVTRILDDEILNRIVFCLENEAPLRFVHRGKERLALPLEIITDFYTGRQYMSAMEGTLPQHKKRKASKAKAAAKNAGETKAAAAARKAQAQLAEKGKAFSRHIVIPLEDMTKAEEQPEIKAAETALRPPRPPHDLVLHFFYRHENECAKIKEQIRQRFPEAVLEETSGGILRAALQAPDTHRLIPWLRTFYPKLAACGTEKAHLAEKMENDLEEALKNYGLCPAFS